jgi:hypothetical protein
MKKMSYEGNQIHNFISSSGSGTVINYCSGSGSDFLTSYGSDSGSTSQKVTVSTVPVLVPSGSTTLEVNFLEMIRYPISQTSVPGASLNIFYF